MPDRFSGVAEVLGMLERFSGVAEVPAAMRNLPAWPAWRKSAECFLQEALLAKTHNLKICKKDDVNDRQTFLQ